MSEHATVGTRCWEVILSENQEQEMQSKAFLGLKPPDRGERVEGAREDDPYYEAFFDRKVEGVLLTTAAGEICDASDVACRLLRRPREELIGDKVESIFDPSDSRLAAARGHQRSRGFFRGQPFVKDIDQHKRAEMILRSFTPRELQVLELLTHGFTNRQIACELYISANTAKFHVQHVIEKLGVTDRTAAAYRAAELGLVPDSTEKQK